MIQKKVMYTGLIALLIVFLLTSFATAGLGDWIKSKITGEPQLAPDFEASVNIKSLPPVITIIKVDDPNVVQDDEVDVPEEGVENEVIVIFTVYDPNGENDLPTSPITVQAVPSGSGEIYARFTKTNGNKADVTLISQAGNCVEDPACPDCTPGQESFERQYECTIPGFQYYHEPSSSGSTVWQSEISMRDNSGTPTLVDATHIFTLNDLSAVKPTTDLDWNEVNPEDEDTLADTHLAIENTGNIPQTTLNVESHILKGATWNSDNKYLPAEAFSADGIEASACDNTGLATAMVEGSTEIIDEFTLDFGQGETSTIYFCIWNSLTSYSIDLGDSPYIASGTDSWEITVIS